MDPGIGTVVGTYNRARRGLGIGMGGGGGGSEGELDGTWRDRGPCREEGDVSGRQGEGGRDG